MRRTRGTGRAATSGAINLGVLFETQGSTGGLLWTRSVTNPAMCSKDESEVMYRAWRKAICDESGQRIR